MYPKQRYKKNYLFGHPRPTLTFANLLGLFHFLNWNLDVTVSTLQNVGFSDASFRSPPVRFGL